MGWEGLDRHAAFRQEKRELTQCSAKIDELQKCFVIFLTSFNKTRDRLCTALWQQLLEKPRISVRGVWSQFGRWQTAANKRTWVMVLAANRDSVSVTAELKHFYDIEIRNPRFLESLIAEITTNLTMKAQLKSGVTLDPLLYTLINWPPNEN